ncbi:MAG: hypothetical protein B7X53_09335 [Hyphomonas sp. 34-62-18]|nr:hypothetical protein [Hyphomonas sp. 34-62-18]OZB16238.1 MAG: hypothetical protein B7X53_09335 [Hyphomonas sp. 34-62-18]
MEEILASIRKIIADDGPAPTAGRPVMREVTTEPASSRPSFSYDNDADDLGMFEGDDIDLADEIADEVAEEFTTEIKGPEFSFEAILGASTARGLSSPHRALPRAPLNPPPNRSRKCLPPRAMQMSL